MAVSVAVSERLAAPVSATGAPSAFRTPLYTPLPDFPAYLETLVQFPFAEEVEKAGLFRNLRERLLRNLEATDPKAARLPTRHTSSDPRTLIDAYHAGTPFPDFLGRTISLPVSQETFFRPVHVVGGYGAGKPHVLQPLCLHHLDPEDPTGR